MTYLLAGHLLSPSQDYVTYSRSYPWFSTSSLWRVRGSSLVPEWLQLESYLSPEGERYYLAVLSSGWQAHVKSPRLLFLPWNIPFKFKSPKPPTPGPHHSTLVEISLWTNECTKSDGRVALLCILVIHGYEITGINWLPTSLQPSGVGCLLCSSHLNEVRHIPHISRVKNWGLEMELNRQLQKGNNCILFPACARSVSIPKSTLNTKIYGKTALIGICIM